MNADGIIGANGGLQGYNLFAYCNNNPVMYSDPSGNIAISTAVAIGGAVVGIAGLIYAHAHQDEINQSINGMFSILTRGNSTSIGLTDLLPSPDEILKEKLKSKEKSEAKDIDIAIDRYIPEDTVIYRYGGTNPGNLTPRQKDFLTGLSFSTIPKPGAAMITIGALNRTGVLLAIKDGPTHVSVRPIGGTVQEWINTGPNSVWTQSVKSVVAKYNGSSWHEFHK